MRKRIILDVDTGTDDAVALMVAALSPALELVGATTVNGNVPVAYCTDNTLRVFDYIGVDVPVFEGMSQALLRPDFDRGDWPVSLELPPARSRKQPQHAVDWLIETYLASDGDITLVPVGPLTNVALAIRREPRILPKIPELVIMGGGHALGNMTPSAEFNIWVDPEAARVVLNCGRPIRLLPLDATHKALVSTAEVERLRALGTPAGEAAAICIGPRIEMYDSGQPMQRPGTTPVHDALAVCAIIDPTVITTSFINVDVETRGELTTG
ncbi:MAG TPA: nucleoside hydrolase, partial [Ardenticatenaceae bacterium]|nr:nucleoside hydrolase [Ardenticatenaceae bacterium]